MYVRVKYLILVMGFIATLYAIGSDKIGAGMAAAGAFIAYAILEKQDLQTMNQEDEK